MITHVKSRFGYPIEILRSTSVPEETHPARSRHVDNRVRIAFFGGCYILHPLQHVHVFDVGLLWGEGAYAPTRAIDTPDFDSLTGSVQFWLTPLEDDSLGMRRTGVDHDS